MEDNTRAEAGEANWEHLLSADAPQHAGSVSLEPVELSPRFIKLAHQPR